jgi:hypothetical protein
MLAYECWILISLGLIVFRRVYKNNSTFRDEFSQNPFLFLLPLVTAIGGVVFWFVTAPDMRFGEGVLF